MRWPTSGMTRGLIICPEEKTPVYTFVHGLVSCFDARISKLTAQNPFFLLDL